MIMKLRHRYVKDTSVIISVFAEGDETLILYRESGQRSERASMFLEKVSMQEILRFYYRHRIIVILVLLFESKAFWM